MRPRAKLLGQATRQDPAATAEKPSIVFRSAEARNKCEQDLRSWRADVPGNANVTRLTAKPGAVAVLDTNVVLDWLVFDDPAAAHLQRAIEAGQLRWIATAAMRDELQHVLSRGDLDKWRPDPDKLWSAWRLYCEECAAPERSSPWSALRCSDPDDQMFIDLAVAFPARWLISRDRALLKLAPGLRAASVEVLTPLDWASKRTSDLGAWPTCPEAKSKR